MEGQLKNCEKACEFLGKQYEDQKNELKAAKSNISSLQKRCNDLEDTCKDYEMKASKTHKKLLDLESRNMRENLVFHGLPENVGENCETVVKEFCVEKLKLSATEVQAIVFDRVHRIGRADKVKSQNFAVNIFEVTKFSTKHIFDEMSCIVSSQQLESN